MFADFGVSLRERCAVGELGDRHDVCPGLIRRGRAVAERRPDLGVEERRREALRHHANHRVRFAIELHGPADDAGSPPKCRCHAPWLSTASVACRVSSSTVKMRPSSGPSIDSPSISALTAAVLTTAGSSPVPSTRSAVVNAASRASVRLRSRNRTTIDGVQWISEFRVRHARRHEVQIDGALAAPEGDRAEQCRVHRREQRGIDADDERERRNAGQRYTQGGGPVRERPDGARTFRQLRVPSVEKPIAYSSSR